MTSEQEPRDLAVTYDDMGEARAAIQSLERAGVEGGDITLLGKADTAALEQDNIARDERLLTYLSRAVRVGFLIGLAIGAAIGVALGAALFPWLSGAMWATVGGGAFLGSGLGVLVGGIVTLPQSNAGLAAIDTDYKGRVQIGVRRTKPSAADDVIEDLQETSPAEIAEIDDMRRALVEDRRRAGAGKRGATQAQAPDSHPASMQPGMEPPRTGRAGSARRWLVASAAATVVAGAAVALIRVRRR